MIEWLRTQRGRASDTPAGLRGEAAPARGQAVQHALPACAAGVWRGPIAPTRQEAGLRRRLRQLGVGAHQTSYVMRFIESFHPVTLILIMRSTTRYDRNLPCFGPLSALSKLLPLVPTRDLFSLSLSQAASFMMLPGRLAASLFIRPRADVLGPFDHLHSGS